MGWNEEDDEDYVITEDDVREFEKLSKEIKEVILESCPNSGGDKSLRVVLIAPTFFVFYGCMFGVPLFWLYHTKTMATTELSAKIIRNRVS